MPILMMVVLSGNFKFNDIPDRSSGSGKHVIAFHLLLLDRLLDTFKRMQRCKNTVKVYR